MKFIKSFILYVVPSIKWVYKFTNIQDHKNILQKRINTKIIINGRKHAAKINLLPEKEIF